MYTKKFLFNKKNINNNQYIQNSTTNNLNNKIYQEQDIYTSYSNVYNTDKYYEKCNSNYISEPTTNIILREQGPRGPRGYTGPQGIQGEQGTPGGILGYADFFAIIPQNNSATVAPGADVEFPQDGPNSANIAMRSSSNTFSLTEAGTYLIMFQVNVTEAGQLVIALNDAELAYTVSGRATGTNQIMQTSIITITDESTQLSIRNPASKAAALTITPLAGGTEPVSTHLIIIKHQ